MEQSPICVENCRRLDEIVKVVAEETGTNEMAHKAIEHRLRILEQGYQQQNNILITMQKQADAIEAMSSKMDDLSNSVGKMSDRIAGIEREPADNWKKMGFEIVKYIVLLMVGAMLAQVSRGLL